MRTRWMAIGAGVVAVMALARLGAQPAGPVTIAIAVDQPGAAIASTMYGMFFEDINLAADGGIYAEKIKNRSFEFPDPLMGWKRAAVDGARGSFAAATEAPPSPANARYLRITSEAGRFGVTNDGFRGIGVRKGERYTVSLLARRRGAGPTSLVVEFEDPRNQSQGGTTLTGLTTSWARYRGDGHGHRDLGQPHAIPRAGRRPGHGGHRHGVGVPRGHVAGARERAAQGPRPAAEGHEAGVPPLPRRLHRRGPVPRGPLPVEDDHRRPGRAQADRQPVERRVRQPRDAGLLPVVRAWLLRVFPAVRGPRRRAAADRQLRHGLPVQLGRAGAA